MNEAKILPCRCWFFDTNGRRHGETQWEPGILYAWSTDNESDEFSAPRPVGVIEDTSGKMHSVYVPRISVAEESPAEA